MAGPEASRGEGCVPISASRSNKGGFSADCARAMLHGAPAAQRQSAIAKTFIASSFAEGNHGANARQSTAHDACMSEESEARCEGWKRPRKAEATEMSLPVAAYDRRPRKNQQLRAILRSAQTPLPERRPRCSPGAQHWQECATGNMPLRPLPRSRHSPASSPGSTAAARQAKRRRARASQSKGPQRPTGTARLFSPRS